MRERRREEEGDEADEVEAAADEAGGLEGGWQRLGACQQRPGAQDAQEQPGAVHDAVEDLLCGEVPGDLRAEAAEGGAAGVGQRRWQRKQRLRRRSDSRAGTSSTSSAP